MKKKLALAQIIVVLITSTIRTPTLHAQTNRDPVKMRCFDAQTANFPKSDGFKAPQHMRRQNGQIVFRKGEWVEIKVELRRSQRCQGKWVKAYNVPEGTELYLEDNSRPRSRKYVTYTALVNGQNYSDMSNPQDYQRVLRACIRFPKEAYKYSDKLRKPLCTNFSR
ncbi:MAG: hypothetical protein AAF915_13235 [Cyanobacteria bacterium P01_D01_bin.50]